MRVQCAAKLLRLNISRPLDVLKPLTNSLDRRRPPDQGKKVDSRQRATYVRVSALGGELRPIGGNDYSKLPAADLNRKSMNGASGRALRI
jgi:hypothetical protein